MADIQKHENNDTNPTYNTRHTEPAVINRKKKRYKNPKEEKAQSKP